MTTPLGLRQEDQTRLPQPTIGRKRQLACCCGFDARVLATREPRAIPRQPGPDQRFGHVMAVDRAPADPSTEGALLGEVAHHRPPLDECLGLDAAWLARVTAIGYLRRGQALQPQQPRRRRPFVVTYVRRIRDPIRTTGAASRERWRRPWRSPKARSEPQPAPVVREVATG